MYYGEMNKIKAARLLNIYGDGAIAKSEDNDLEKGGEGSKGGKVIGHTKSGKPVYENHGHKSHSKFTHQEHHEAYLMHDKNVSDGDMGQIDARDYHNSRAKKKAKEETDNSIGWTESGKRIRSDRDANHEGYSDFTKKDHADAAEAHFKEMGESGGDHKKHENSFKKYASHKDKSDEMKKSESLSILDSIANDTFEKSMGAQPNLDEDKEISEETAPESSEDGGKETDEPDEKKEEKKEEPKEPKMEKSESYFVADASEFMKGQRDRILSCFKEEGAK